MTTRTEVIREALGKMDGIYLPLYTAANAALDALTREIESCKRFAAEHEGGLPDDDLFIWMKHMVERETAQAKRIATLEEALATAKEAMDERRGYVNGGDPSGCWPTRRSSGRRICRRHALS